MCCGSAAGSAEGVAWDSAKGVGAVGSAVGSAEGVAAGNTKGVAAGSAEGSPWAMPRA